jgi:outer membrane protein assembly factor BamB
MSMRTSRRAFLAACGAVTLSGCSAPIFGTGETTPTPRVSLSNGAWSTYGFDSTHTGYNPESTGPHSDPTQAWSTRVEGVYTLSEPIVDDGQAFVGSKTYMYAFDTHTGKNTWRATLESMPYQFTPTLSDGRLYVASKTARTIENGVTGYLRALAPDTGDLIWRISLPVSSSPVFAEGRLLIASMVDDRGNVHSVHPEDGKLGWKFTVPGGPSAIVATPAVFDGLAYVPVNSINEDGSNSGELYVLSVDDGSVAWSFETNAPLTVPPVIAGGTVYLAGSDGTIHALDTAGDVRWTIETGDRIASKPAIADRTLYTLVNGRVIATDATTGERRWHTPIERTLMTGVAVADGTVFVGGEPLFALSAADGSVVFETTIDGYHGSYGAPVAVGETLFAGVCIKEKPTSQYDNYVRAIV